MEEFASRHHGVERRRLQRGGRMWMPHRIGPLPSRAQAGTAGLTFTRVKASWRRRRDPGGGVKLEKVAGGNKMSDRIRISVHGTSPGSDVIPLVNREAQGLISRHGRVRQCQVIIEGSRYGVEEGSALIVRILLVLPECMLASRTRVGAITGPEDELTAVGRAFEEAESLLDHDVEMRSVPTRRGRPLHPC